MIRAAESLDVLVLFALNEPKAIEVDALAAALRVDKLNILSDIHTFVAFTLGSRIVVVILKYHAIFLVQVESETCMASVKDLDGNMRSNKCLSDSL